MRLNRVLLLAATINILIFALVFTISCSDGKNGNPGAKGVGCVVNDAWQIICDGEPKGQLSGDAPRGPAGDNGKDGKDGVGCKLGEEEGSSYPIYCGGVPSGYLDGCNVSEINKYEIVIACGSTTVNLCKGSPFDTKEKNCDANGDLQSGATAGANGKCPDVDGRDRDYDTRTHYCGFVIADSAGGVKPHTIIKLCPGVSSPSRPNETSWKNEFCEYTNATEGRIAGGATPYGLCGNGSRINEGGWNNQYCGYPEKGTITEATKGACDNSGPGILANGSSTSAAGPNAIAFRQGYCQASKDGKTTYSEERCDPSANPLTDSTTNRPNFNTWKYQYCGYKSPTSTFRDTLFGGIKDGKADASLAALCDDGNGPHLSSNSAGYCGWIDKDGTYGSSSSIILKGGTVLLSPPCGQQSATNKNPTGPNATGWKYEYCAFTGIELTYSSSSLVSAENGGKSVTSGRCDLTTTLSSSSGSNILYPIYSIIYSSSAGYGEYAKVSQSASGPNQTFFNGGFGTSATSAKAFCTYDPFYGKTRTSGYEDFCNDGSSASSLPTQMNKDTWKGQYCVRDAISGRDKLWTDACDDGTKPNLGNSGSSAASDVYCGVTFTNGGSSASLSHGTKTTRLSACSGAMPNKDGWKNEYCGVSSASTGGVHVLSKDLCGDGFGPAMSSAGSADWKPIGGFCKMPSANSTYTVLSEYCGGGFAGSSGSAYNQGSWQNEYCFTGSDPANSSSSGSMPMVKTCPGGWVGDTTKYGGLADTVRCSKPKPTP